MHVCMYACCVFGRAHETERVNERGGGRERERERERRRRRRRRLVRAHVCEREKERSCVMTR